MANSIVKVRGLLGGLSRLLYFTEEGDMVFAKSINEVTSSPTHIKEFIEKHGPEQPQFEQWKCPECGAEYNISWVWCEIKRRRPQH